MAYHGYMSIKGRSQRLISAGCSTIDSIGNRCQAAHVDEIMGFRLAITFPIWAMSNELRTVQC